MKLSKTSGRVLFLLMLATGAQGVAAQSKKEAAGAVPDWGMYRGPKRDGISPDTGLLKEWPKGGPTLAWKMTGIGGGYSGVSVVGKFGYTMGEDGGSQVIIAFNTADGKIVWKAKVSPTLDPDKRGPGPHCTPACDGQVVIGTGVDGTMVCVRAANGQEMWRKNYKDLGAGSMPGWGYSDSPIIDQGMVICIPGGSKGTVAALNKTNGAPVWQSGELKDGAQYTSLAMADFGNIPQYIVFTMSTVAGIVAKTGRVAWEGKHPGATAVCSTPVATKEGIVFASSGYGVGNTAFQVAFAGGAFKATQLYAGKQLESHHGDMVAVGDHIYGLDQGALKCVEAKTGKLAWTDRCVGKGSITYADGHLYCRGEKGGVALVEAVPDSYKEKGRFDQPDRSKYDAWSHPTVFGGHLYLRDQDVLLCYSVSGK